MTAPPRLLSGIGEVADRYDGYLLDLWGTVHDGYRPLPGVLDAMTALKDRGKRILIISNAPRRNDAVIERMDAIGIPGGLYDAVLSSGEAAHRALRDRADPVHAALGRACYHLGPARDDSALIGLDIDLVDDVAAADFILNTGLDKAEETVADYEPVLSAGADRGVTMICANPDLVVLRGDVRELCAGALAVRYAEIGGPVIYHGKPHAPIYATAFDLLGITDRDRLVAVGDSLRTDIAGARAAGIASVLVLGGIHALEAGDADGLACLYAEAGAIPDYTLPGFTW